MSARPVLVVGAGITGLACAFDLLQAGVDVLVLERSPRAGGNLSTTEVDGFLIDSGPDSWLATKPEGDGLAVAMGLRAELMPSLAKKVYIAHAGELHAMPEGLVLGIPTSIRPLAKSSLFTPFGKARMALDLVEPRRPLIGDDDESVASFITRRLGEEALERLVGPLLGGIFAGDPSSISVRAAFPQLVDAEQRHGSLIRAMRAQKREREHTKAAEIDANFAERPSMVPPRPGESSGGSAFHSLKRGMGSLVDALVERLGPDRVRTGCGVARVERNGTAWAVTTETGERIATSAVVLATGARLAAKVLADDLPDLSTLLARLCGYVSSAIVFYAFERGQLEHDLDGSGFIVPRAEGRPMLASTWVSSKWAHRAPEGHALLRVFLGGAGHEHVVADDDASLAALGLRELSRYVPVRGAPLFARVHRFEKASAQPYVGHLARVARLRERLTPHPRLLVAGSGLDGVGIPDCIRQGRAAAAKLTASSSPSAVA